MRAGIVAVIALLVSCAAPAEQQASPASGDPTPAVSAGAATPTPSAETSAAPRAVPAALDWRAPRVGGGQVDGRALAGDVALWFWAPW